jgi:hypothetical protein
MKKLTKYRIKYLLKTIVMFAFYASITFAFFSFCNVSLNPAEWGGFSRFIFGVATLFWGYNFYIALRR